MTWGDEPLREVEQVREWLRAAEPGAEVRVAYARRKRPLRILDRRPWESGELTLQLAAARAADRRADGR